MTEGKIVGCYPDSMDCECEQTLGVGDGQGGLGSQRVRHDLVTEKQQQIYNCLVWGLPASPIV